MNLRVNSRGKSSDFGELNRAAVAESPVPVAVVDGGGSGSGVDPLDAAFLKIVTDQTAGNPMKPGVLWTNLSARQIVRELKAAGFGDGRRAVRRLMRKHRLGRRKAAKVLVMGGGGTVAGNADLVVSIHAPA